MSTKFELRRKQIYMLVVLAITFLACSLPDLVPDKCSTSYLITKITAANVDPSPETIELAPNCVYELDEIDNANTYGDNGLPVISTPIIIKGYNATITRSTVAGTPEFRFFYINPSGNLTLENVIITNGSVGSATEILASGGAILNHQGDLTIIDSTISGNISNKSGGGGCGQSREFDHHQQQLHRESD